MIAEETILPCSTYSLADCLSEYFALRQINKKKYFASYLIGAKHTWKQLFEKTIYAMSSEWKTVKNGDPYPYVDVPRGAQRIFSIAVNDDCGDVKPIYYNPRMNIIPKPAEKKCGCNSCQCGGLCEDVNSTVLTTNVLFTINGIPYSEKIWLKYCPNGDMIEYKEIPTKKYNDFRGDGGDYNNDFNNDYSIGSPGFSNFTIVTNTFQRKICTLKTLPCGCPVEDQENEELIQSHCGCFLPFFGHHRKKHCDHFLAEPNTSELGEVKISECGTRIYFKPGHKHHRCRDGNHKRIPDFLLVIYQTGGEPENISDQVQVPTAAAYKDAVWDGIDYQSKRFNNKYTLAEKTTAKYAYNDSCNGLVTYLNPLNMQDLGDMQDSARKW
jgi:hypothetical protein